MRSLTPAVLAILAVTLFSGCGADVAGSSSSGSSTSGSPTTSGSSTAGTGLSSGGSSSSGSTSGTSPPSTGAAHAPATMAHIISYGQSISLGQYSVNKWPSDKGLPAEPIDVGSMFVGGTRPDDLSSLVPFQDSSETCNFAVWNCDYAGETPLYGAMSELQATGLRLLGSCAGRSGTAIAGLQKGTQPYQRLIDQVEAGQSLADGPYEVLGVIWIQGSADTGNTAYAGEFTQLINDLDADIRAVTHQAKPIQFYVCLPTPPDIAAIQQQVASSMPQVHISCDTTKLEHISDGKHLTAAAERQAGQMLGTDMAKEFYKEQNP
jgi:hypothetical protein